MDIDSALTLISLVSFLVLIASWLIAPVGRGAAAVAPPVAEAARPAAVAH